MQRVASASVEVEGKTVGSIDAGLAVLVGVSPSDGSPESEWLADKVVGLRIFSDADGKMNLCVEDIGGGILLVSQFTLYGDARRGRRPSFTGAARGPAAEALYEELAERIRNAGVPCSTGLFGAQMQVSLTNDGPVTILLDSDKTF